MDLLAASASSPAAMAQSPMVAPASGSRNLWVLLIISIAVLTASLCGLLFYLLRGKLLPVFRRPTRNRKGSLRDEKRKLRRFEFEEVEKATKNFGSECLLGSGSFANVYKGNLENEGTVAIKRPHADSYTSIEEFRNEVKLLSTVKHKNLVALVGYCEETGKRGERILVYEYVPNGSLLDYIIGREGRSLTWRQRVNIAIGAARGIAHLHIGMKASIIHRDIKPSNILVGDGFEAKVSDFGLVRSGPIGDRSHVSSQIKGTPGYLDPAYCSSFHLTPFSDVYSFGVILLQLISARPVLDSNKAKSSCHIVEWARPSLEMGRVEEILDANLLFSEPCNMEVMLKMGRLGLECTSQQPKQRPTMTRVWQELEEALLLADNSITKKIVRQKTTELRPQRSMEFENSQSLVSIEGIRLEKFHMEMDSFTFRSASLRCLESDSICIDIDQTGLKQLPVAANAEENKN